ncbi:hypothetical protein [Oscillatoria sp. FACHB-1406]|nr:hypothetical protein [Oscillatoria sp. FACHB-1406]
MRSLRYSLPNKQQQERGIAIPNSEQTGQPTRDTLSYEVKERTQ